MNGTMVMLYLSDLSGISRGKTFPMLEAEQVFKEGVGWIPSNAGITCFGNLAPVDNDALGELKMFPVEEQFVSLRNESLDLDMGLWLGRVDRLDGYPWECCLRSQLQRAENLLLKNHGICLQVGVEQEFYCIKPGNKPLNAYSFDAYERASRYLDAFAKCLITSKVPLKSLHAENGPGQYELTLKPMAPTMAADQLIAAKEIGKLCARRLDERITFSPIINSETIGSGLHVHFSLHDLQGNPLNSSEGTLVSTISGAFVSGILGHLPSLLGFNSPSLISPERYKPPRWTAYFNNLGMQDRRAAIRISRLGEGSPGIHFELRTADAAASPYLVLSSMLYAGMEGLSRKIQCPPPYSTDELLKGLIVPGVCRLPDTLEKCLANLLENEALLSHYPEAFVKAYFDNKRHEIKLASLMRGQELYDSYMQCY